MKTQLEEFIEKMQYYRDNEILTDAQKLPVNYAINTAIEIAAQRPHPCGQLWESVEVKDGQMPEDDKGTTGGPFRFSETVFVFTDVEGSEKLTAYYSYDDKTWIESESGDNIGNVISFLRPYAGKGYSLEQLKEAYNDGVKEGGEQTGNFEWGIRRTDIEFEEWFFITHNKSLPSPQSTK